MLQVIALTEELLATAKQNEMSSSNAVPNADTSPSLSNPMENKGELDSSYDHEQKFPVGSKIQAVWSDDGEWYEATIEAHTPNGYYVRYENWGNREEVDPANIRLVQEGIVDALLEAERVAEATKQAIKRKISQAASVDFQSRSLPAKLRIEPDDPEDVVRCCSKFSFFVFLPLEFIDLSSYFFIFMKCLNLLSIYPWGSLILWVT